MHLACKRYIARLLLVLGGCLRSPSTVSSPVLYDSTPFCLSPGYWCYRREYSMPLSDLSDLSEHYRTYRSTIGAIGVLSELSEVFR